MATTFTLISTITVGSGGAASIDFTSIPATYTDLCLKVSARTSYASQGDWLNLSFNGSTSSFTMRYLQGTGAAAQSGTATRFAGYTCTTFDTSNTFASSDIYITNYANTSINKSYSIDNCTENNATSALSILTAGLWSNTAAINQITLTTQNNNLVQYSSASLYGILKA